jgi:uncharacterized membrane protein YdfJ with MMPL/SSD domain
VSVALAVALTMAASVTLLPAMLGFLGLKVLRRAERGTLVRRLERGRAGAHEVVRGRRAAPACV